jgi:hypothetical protein
MAPGTTFDEPPEFDVGDRVVTTEAIGPRWHRTAAPGARGIVIARTAERLVAVRFEDGHVDHIHPSSLALAPPAP